MEVFLLSGELHCDLHGTNTERKKSVFQNWIFNELAFYFILNLSEVPYFLVPCPDRLI